MRLALFILVLVAATAPAPADPNCRSPPPVFHCGDWHRDDEGRLTSTKPNAAGLIELGANFYLGDHTIIDGIDYTEALQKQCGR